MEQVPGPLEIKFRIGVQQEVCLVGPAKPMSELDVRSRPTGMYMVLGVDTYEKAGAEQGDQRRGLRLVYRTFDVALHLARRFATATLDVRQSAVAKISRVQFANPVVGKPGAFPDCARARLVADHPECQLELAAFPCVAIVGESHFLLFMIEKDHIRY